MTTERAGISQTDSLIDTEHANSSKSGSHADNSHLGLLVGTGKTDNSESNFSAEFKPTDSSQLGALTGTGLTDSSVIEAGWIDCP